MNDDFDSTEHRCVFVGRDTVTIAWVKYGYDEKGIKTVYVRKEGTFRKGWLPMFQNLKGNGLLSHYEERYLIRPSKGRTNTIVRVYFFDFDDLTPYAGKLNPEELAKIESSIVEATYHELVAGDAKEFSEVSASQDLIHKKTKDDVDYIRGLFPRSSGDDSKSGGKKK